MNTVSGFPFVEITFDKSGAVVQRADVDGLLAFLKAEQEAGRGITDLLVMSHGWLTDQVGATSLYSHLLANARALIDANKLPGLAGKRIAVIGVVWPSKQFGQTQQATSNAASFDAADFQQDLAAQIDQLIASVDDPAREALLQQAKGLLGSVADDPAAQDAFVDHIRTVVLSESLPAARLAGDVNVNDDNEASFQSEAGRDIIERLSQPIFIDPTAGTSDGSNDSNGSNGSEGTASSMEEGSSDGSDTGSAAGFGDILSGIKGGLQNFLNLTTFYLMKARAGTVGHNGVYPTLKEIIAAYPGLNIHLFGHSFGARLVTAVAQGPAGSFPLPIHSMMLAQGAFSHGGFSNNFDGQHHAGGFRSVMDAKRIIGPIVVTYTKNDTTVGVAYPMGVRLDHDNASALGDANDIFGGIGRNGAQKTPEAQFQTMQDVGGTYSLQAGTIYNLNSDAYIKSHVDIVHDQVLYALFHAIQAGSAPIDTTPSTPPTAPTPTPTTPTTPVSTPPASTPPTSTPPATTSPGGPVATAPSPQVSAESAADGQGSAASFEEAADPTGTVGDAIPPVTKPVAAMEVVDPTPSSSASAVVSPAQGETTQASDKKDFDQSMLDMSVIALPLLALLKPEMPAIQRRLTLIEQKNRQAVDPQSAALSSAQEAVLAVQPKLYDIIIDVNLNHTGQHAGAKDEAKDEAKENEAEATTGALPISSRELAKKRVYALMSEVLGDFTGKEVPQTALPIDWPKTRLSSQYIFANVEGAVICEMVRRDRQSHRHTDQSGSRAMPGHRAIYRIWNDFEIRALLTESISTVKANAAHISFGAMGRGIVWAVMDSGIDQTHQHFLQYKNLDVPSPLQHTDFTGMPRVLNDVNPALCDNFGHGTHVAGIIAGAQTATSPASTATGTATPANPLVAISRHRDESGAVTYEQINIPSISGIAPECKVISLRVLDDSGSGKCSNIMAAISYVQEINGYGRRIQIHGVNLSVGYDFDPEWFACGQSPLCIEVNRLVRSGVVVVIAAGNTGYGFDNVKNKGAVAAGLALSINDPGNAELAITVGSTHREMPHIYGVSYFSSKGPTGDGRDKPDLVAPGEKILSCAAGKNRNEATQKSGANCDYVEQSGTSMAAPHVSGAVAAFLSIRQEFIGRPEEVKQIFCNTATDLKRMRHFQGSGLVDLMRAIQSV